MTQKTDKLLRTILIGTAIPTVVVWLPLVRGAMDGPSYEWGHSFLGLRYGGQGVQDHYWLIALQAMFVIALLYLGWRGARQPFHWFLLIWSFSQAADAIYNAVQFPDRYRFRGDTLGVDVSLAWVGPILFGGLALLSVIWVVRDLKRGNGREAPPWGRANTVWLAVAAGLIPLQIVLLRFGEPHGTTDQIGVILTMLQWVFLNLSFVPRPLPRSEH